MDVDGQSEPNGGDIEDCTAIHLHRLPFHASWEDVPCAIKSYDSFICKQPSNSGFLNLSFIS